MPEEKLAKIKVKDIRDIIVQNPATIDQDSSLEELLSKILEDSSSRHVYVINEKNKLIGSVRLNNTIMYLFPTAALMEDSEFFSVSDFMEYSSAKKVKDIMNRVCSYAFEDMYITEMIRIMIKEKVNELPVINKNFEIIGEVNVLEIISFYLKNNVDS